VLVRNCADVNGNKIYPDYSYGQLRLTRVHKILGASYGFCVLSFFIMIVVILLLLVAIFKGNFVTNLINKILIVALLITNALSILIFTGINKAFKDDQNHDDGTGFAMCQQTCTNSFHGSKTFSSQGYKIKWYPDAGWDLVVIAWPLVAVAAVMILFFVKAVAVPTQPKPDPPKPPVSPVSVEMTL